MPPASTALLRRLLLLAGTGSLLLAIVSCAQLPPTAAVARRRRWRCRRSPRAKPRLVLPRPGAIRLRGNPLHPHERGNSRDIANRWRLLPRCPARTVSYHRRQLWPRLQPVQAGLPLSWTADIFQDLVFAKLDFGRRRQRRRRLPARHLLRLGYTARDRAGRCGAQPVLRR
jgi:hypothetical protein